MRPNLFSIITPNIRKVTQTICLCSILLAACQGIGPGPVTPTPVSTPQPLQTTTRVSIDKTLPIDTTEPQTTQIGSDLNPVASGTQNALGDAANNLPTDMSATDSLLGPIDLGGTPSDQVSETQQPLNEALGTTPEPTQAVQFKPTSAGVPLGDPGNPIMLGVVIGKSEAEAEKKDASQQLALQLSQATGYTIEVQQVYTNTELLNGMQVGAIQMAWLQPFTYILASRRGYAKATLVTNHFGVYSYGAQFLANTKSEFTSYYNSSTNTSTADASEALAQFAEKRPCWVDPLSASGYVVPEGLVMQHKIATLPPIFLQSHTAVVRALYVQGICDFGVTFAIYGDPRTSSTIQKDMPDIMQKVTVIWQTGEIIPNLNLSFQTKVPDAIVKKITQAMDDLVLGEEGRQIITNANAYDIQDLKTIDDTYYDPLRELVKYSLVNLKTLIGK